MKGIILLIFAIFFIQVITNPAFAIDGEFKLKDGSILKVNLNQRDEKGEGTFTKFILGSVSKLMVTTSQVGYVDQATKKLTFFGHDKNAAVKLLPLQETIYIVEYDGFQNMIPVRIAQIECKPKCQWSKDTCGFEKPFRIPDEVLFSGLQYRLQDQKVLTSFSEGLAKASSPEEYCKSQLGNFSQFYNIKRYLRSRAFSGEKRAQSCYEALQPNALASIKSICPSSDSPEIIQPVISEDPYQQQQKPLSLEEHIGLFQAYGDGFIVAPLFNFPYQDQGFQQPLYSAGLRPVRLELPTTLKDLSWTPPLDRVEKLHGAPNFPKKWSLVFDGKTIGEVRVLDPGLHGFPVAKMSEPLRTQVDKILKQGHYVYATPRKSVSDPEKWSRKKLSSTDIEKIKMKILPLRDSTKFLCKKHEGEEFGTYEKSTQPLTISDLEHDEKSYSSKDGKLLLGIWVSLPSCPTEDYHPIELKWYILSKTGQIEEIPNKDQLVNPLVPQDAADFDGNGTSEWIFYNKDLGEELILYEKTNNKWFVRASGRIQTRY